MKAAATKLFDRFFHADTFEGTVDSFNAILDVVGIRSGCINQFYPIIRVRDIVFSHNATKRKSFETNLPR